MSSIFHQYLEKLINAAPDGEVEPFWIEQPSVLWRNDGLFHIKPSRNNTIVENLNIMTRIMLYVSFVLIILDKWDYIIFPMIGLIIILIYYFIVLKDNPEDPDCVANLHNPLGNPINGQNNCNLNTNNNRQFYNVSSYANAKNNFTDSINL